MSANGWRRRQGESAAIVLPEFTHHSSVLLEASSNDLFGETFSSQPSQAALFEESNVLLISRAGGVQVLKGQLDPNSSGEDTVEPSSVRVKETPSPSPFRYLAASHQLTSLRRLWMTPKLALLNAIRKIESERISSM
ncbi:hypothetical protein [Streptomyces gardneri]|uniref:hypothetical protein n=1 Tax=Streptomyces gardneri TaxID=66892 RepID=UPI0033FF920F